MDRGVCSIHAREGSAKYYRRLSSGRARMKRMAPGDARPEWAIAWLIGGYATSGRNPRGGRGTEAAERLSTGQSAALIAHRGGSAEEGRGISPRASHRSRLD